MKLARLARANELAVVRVPGPVDEAMRDLVRAREDSVREQRNARHRLKALLLRNGIAYCGKTAWTGAHLRWLATVKMEHCGGQARLTLGGVRSATTTRLEWSPAERFASGSAPVRTGPHRFAPLSATRSVQQGRL